jgi:hypothetical protein
LVFSAELAISAMEDVSLVQSRETDAYSYPSAMASGIAAL